jgi:hypothetical protein
MVLLRLFFLANNAKEGLTMVGVFLEGLLSIARKGILSLRKPSL